MSLSKPVYNLLTSYFMQLYNHPVRTKAVSCCIIATCGNLVSQYLSGCRKINQDSLIAYGLFGLLFGGPIPHYFYGYLERTVPDGVALAVIRRLVIERLIYCPLYQLFSLYMLARLEGKTHDQAIKQMRALFIPVLLASWKWLTIIQLVNFTVVPPMLRVLVTNLVGFFWTVYLANKRRQQQTKKR